MIINDQTKPINVTESAVRLVMLIAIVDNLGQVIKVNLLTDKKLLLNTAYSAIIGKKCTVTIDELNKLDNIIIKKVLNRVITYTYNPKQAVWDYAEYLTYNKKNLFSLVYSDLIKLNKNVISYV